MFVHVLAVDKQYSVQGKKDETLGDVVKQALDYWKKESDEGHYKTTIDDKPVSWGSKLETVAKENDLVKVELA